MCRETTETVHVAFFINSDDAVIISLYHVLDFLKIFVSITVNIHQFSEVVTTSVSTYTVN